ncbi:hypothetical protein [Celeribacter marinus]|uniref:Uncharacterized protein n=1 Tax=Celeribacter marinus TaxID=1397108 RepID=A0A0N9ZFM7_9RHOB|nr:hypothetical protein [Celeribacter marinus]ALI54504.1 hypothetical protein IMCC12053_556 [Celeribacter marinus]SFK78724.1 hypothetical protein SAMN05444421_108116 [Celeribacter marinus]
MGITEDLADQLAKDTIAALELFENEEVIQDIARVIGAGSVTTQEAYLTAARVRLSEKRGRDYLLQRIAEAKAGKAASAPPPSAEDDIEY